MANGTSVTIGNWAKTLHLGQFTWGLGDHIPG
jgi:hypothetical protein